MKQSESASDATLTRKRLTVTGVVQGVGFRPYVYALAMRYSLAGHVGNGSQGVFIEVEGLPDALESFEESLLTEAPPLAYIEQITAEILEPLGENQFVIVHSERKNQGNTFLSPDVCICQDCLNETLDPADRRYRYPFTNCTNCGPRFTIIQDIPYDRPLTSMASFPMCADCQREYDDPLNRRFHAQPNACPVCGPQIWLEMAEEQGVITAEQDQALLAVQSLLREGNVVAVKGLGGFHLACDASNDDALALLRERKGRVDKPFAVMALDLETVRQIAEVSESEAKLLTSKERPIVLLKKKSSSPLSQLVAPGNQMIGVMLPYTPLHYLLLTDVPLPLAALVMTSGNFSDEPIVNDNEEARQHLAPLSDAFLFHNRDIVARCDDSVIRLWRGSKLPVRRSRGYAPFPVKLPFTTLPVLAVGGELKSTFCLTKDNFAYLSQHIGDMENLETLAAFETVVRHFEHIFRVEPQVIACDLHPNYLSTRWALKQAAYTPFVQVQHHHAHIAAVMAEHGLSGDKPVIGFSFDGTGYGTDGAIWGGEVLIADYEQFGRGAFLKYIPLPGGDAAIKRPYRLALAHLWAAGVEWDGRLPPVKACPEVEQAILLKQLENEINTVPTSSMGRLFDAVAAIAGVRQTITYEGQAAIELEALTASDSTGSYQFAYNGQEFDAAPVIQNVVEDALNGVNPAIIGARFHQAVADLILQVSIDLCERTSISQVALSGGVFQNVTLLELTVRRLENEGFEALTHSKVPPNDGGLALGQAIIAAKKFE
ncbi:MAG: carbamoyltransferase HypF [Candidatus Promineifilaceae bacterium]